MTFQARYPRLLALLVLVSSPVWFLPATIIGLARDSFVRRLVRSLGFEIELEASTQVSRIREAYYASIGSFVTEARKRTVWAWQTGKLLATIGLQRAKDAIVRAYFAHAHNRLKALLVIVLSPIIIVYIIYCDGARGLAKDLADEYRQLLATLVTGKAYV